jgi:hypothetical protein
MFYTLLNYIETNYSELLPSHVESVKEKKENNDMFKNNGNLVWATNGSTTVYTDVESGLVKYDFFDIIMKSQ